MPRRGEESAIELLHRRIAARRAVPLVVAGPYRSGTSLVAGVCHALGAHVGRTAKSGNKHNPTTSFEAPLLGRRCRQMYREPWLEESVDRTRRVTLLASWFSMAMNYARGKKLIGGKHPIMCLLVDELLEAWGDRTRFIFVRRPVGEAIESLRRTNWPEWRNSPGSHEHAINLLAEARDRAVDRLGRRCLVVDYHELLERPEVEVERIGAFLGKVDQQRLARATAMVKPELYRTKLDSAS